MSSKVAIVTDEIRKHLSASDPTRPWGHIKPDFKLKRYSQAVTQFDEASQCADAGGGGGTAYGNGFRY